MLDERPREETLDRRRRFRLFLPRAMDREKKAMEAAEVSLTELSPAAEGQGEGLLELLLAEEPACAEPAPAPAAPSRIDGVLVGVLVAIEASGALRVMFPGAPEGGVLARSIATVTSADIGREAALMFEGGDPGRPLLMGLMASVPGDLRPKFTADGDRLELSAEKEIVLRCGDASITLTRAGKILIRGAYVLSRSSGVNRIQGGSVEIN